MNLEHDFVTLTSISRHCHCLHVTCIESLIGAFELGISTIFIQRHLARLSDMNQELYVNQSARSWKATQNIDPRIAQFHSQLPGFQETRLISLDAVAKELGIKRVLVKDETTRIGLPAFKILGASWAIYRALAREVQKEIGLSLDELGNAARAKNIRLFTATDGNHGRAVARMAKILNIEALICVPASLDHYTRDLITSEGCHLEAVDGDYDAAVAEAARQSSVPNGLFVQDTAFQGYEEIPQVRLSIKSQLKAT
jgi:diaminopropionate ammonia-lyase